MKKILVIEDDDHLVKAIKHKLEMLGYDVIVAKDGEEGVKALRQKPDLIWLDLYLPHMDGVEFLEKIKKSEKYKDIPIIIVTVSRGKSEVAKSITGTNVLGYFVKSDVTLEKIVESINKILAQKS